MYYDYYDDHYYKSFLGYPISQKLFSETVSRKDYFLKLCEVSKALR